MRFLVGISLLLVFHTSLVLAEQLHVGPVYTKQPGVVSVVIELPPGVTPTATDFHLLANGNPVATAQEIKSFRDSQENLALVICVDVSGTMDHGPLEDAKEALLQFLGKARDRPGDKIALISFADEDKIVSSFEKTRDQLDDAVRSLKIQGHKTKLYQTIYKALGMFEGADLPKRRRIIVISDGKDEGSTEGALSVTTKSTTLGIPVDTIRHGRIAKQYEEALRYLSDTTGGQFQSASPALPLPVALGVLYRRLLETPSLVVYFKYKADEAGRTIQNALIELTQLAQPPFRGQIPGAIPAPMPEPVEAPISAPISAPIAEEESQKESRDIVSEHHSNVWFWLLGLGLLGIILAVLVRLYKQSHDHQAPETEQYGPSQTEIQQTPFIPPKLETPLVVLEEPPRRTQVGSYYFPTPKPGQPGAILVGLSGPVEGQRFPVEKEILHIGASPENDLLIADDEYVSGDHAYLRYEKGSYFIFDKGSRNGTFVNEHAVTNTGVALGSGDHIQIGISTFEVVIAPS
jgi:hypothetical protein